MSEEHALRVVVFREEGQWVAQGVELDVAAQGQTLDDLFSRFELTLRLDLDECVKRGVDPIEQIGPAPAYYGEMWERRSARLDRGDLKPRASDALAPEYAIAA